jgi:hypothetical protein
MAGLMAGPWVMAGMLMLSGVDDDCGKMNFKKAALVGALKGGLRVRKTGGLRI